MEGDGRLSCICDGCVEGRGLSSQVFSAISFAIVPGTTSARYRLNVCFDPGRILYFTGEHSVSGLSGEDGGHN